MDQVTQLQLSKSTNVEKVRYTYSDTGMGAIPPGPARPAFWQRVERTSPTNPAQWVITDEYYYDDCQRVSVHTDATVTCGSSITMILTGSLRLPTTISAPNSFPTTIWILWQ